MPRSANIIRVYRRVGKWFGRRATTAGRSGTLGVERACEPTSAGVCPVGRHVGRQVRFSPLAAVPIARMSPDDSTPPTASQVPTAVLVLQRGPARLDVFELQPGERLSIGRAPDNRIVVPDAKCSRHHCELFFADGEWVLRDLDSRNGITVDGRRVRDDWPLELGQEIEIGECSLKYALPEPDEPSPAPQLIEGTNYAILERRTGTQFDRAAAPRKPVSTKPFIDLIKLGRAMHEAEDVSDLVDCVLDGLRRAMPASIGVVLLAESDRRDAALEDLHVAGSLGTARSEADRFSTSLTVLALERREAFRVQDVRSDATYSVQASLQALQVTSAIVAPIRYEGSILGVLHLYSTDTTQPLESPHLDYALAVCDHLGAILPNLRRHEAVVHRLEQAQSELHELLEVDTDLVGPSPALQKVKRAIARVARTDATVLIRGESGVGKELVARGVHFNSDRRDGPFVCVNCAALTESLLESELFGHEKGAFTGASQQKPGKFEQAHGGTLFLDEVGEMSPEIQAKFLRVLEGQAFERVGGGKAITVDVRVVTATNRNLEAAVDAGTFRQDLFYRLQVIEILVPPLREHPEDIQPLAQHFLERFARKAVTKVRGFNREALELLRSHTWPGNVRELRNVVERAVILADSPVLAPGDIHLSRLQPTAPASTVRPADAPSNAAALAASSAAASSVAAPASPSSATEAAGIDTVPTSEALWRAYIDQEVSLDDLDRMYFEAVLMRFNWNKSQAARLLGIERTTLDRRLKKYNLRRPPRR